MTTELETQDGWIIGPWRKPVNIDRQDRTNIHNDEDAKKLGFRGGLVAGSIHMEMFIPVLVEAFGEAWLERGNLSMYFMNATLHDEEVRAFVGQPQGDGHGQQVEVYGERPDGTVSGKGTAALGEANAPPALHARDLNPFPAGDLRILEKVHPGDEFPAIETRVTPEDHEERLGVITEMMPCYTDSELWGGLLASPVTFVNALAIPANAWLAQQYSSLLVGLYSAIEMRYVKGPLLVDKPYQGAGKVLAVGQSPKTEYLWYDSHVESENGQRVAEMRMMLRFMKTSSVLYDESATTHT